MGGKRSSDSPQIFRYINLQDTRKSLISQTSPTYSTTKEIQLKSDGSGFLERRIISKDIVRSFDDMERLILVKERLTKYSTHHLDIFGILESISTSEKYFIFNFKYVPYVCLKELINSALSQEQINILVDKIWLLISCMRSNGYEEYIIRLMERNELSQLFDKIEYNFDGNLLISDIGLVLEEKTSNIRLTCKKEK